MSGEMKTPCTWIADLYPTLVVVDADGWRQDDLSFFAEVTQDEFERRFAHSTIAEKGSGWSGVCDND